MSIMTQGVLRSLEKQIEEFKAAGKLREAAEAERELIRQTQAIEGASGGIDTPPPTMEAISSPTPAADGASILAERAAAREGNIEVPAPSMSLRKKAAIGTGIGGGAAGAAYLASGEDEAKKTPTKPSPAPEPLQLEPLSTEDGGGSAGIKTPGYIPYRKVRNYLEDLEAPPSYDASDLNQKLDRNQEAGRRQAEALKQQIDGLMAVQRLTADGLKKQEIAEKIAAAVGLMAAGAIGLKTGHDLSGVKFNQTDWQAKANEAQRDLNNSLMAAKEKYGVDEAVLKQERQRLMDSKQERNALYEMAYRNWSRKGDQLKYKTDYEQQERGYQDSLERWNEEMLARAERTRPGGKDEIEALAKERESELDKATSEWQKLASGIAKLKQEDDKLAAAQALKLLDAKITAMRGYSMVKDPAIYTSDKGMFGGDWEDIIGNAAQQQRNIEVLRARNPKVSEFLDTAGTRLAQYTRQYRQEGKRLRDADAMSRIRFRKELDALIKQGASQAQPQLGK